MRLGFAGVDATIEVPDCPEFLATLEAATPGWRFAPTSREGEPVIRIEKRDGRYAILWPDGDESSESAVGAACAAVAEVCAAYAEERSDQLCLHCGGVILNARLVAFPSRSHAGKSTLIARLAAGGYRIFCDDVLPLAANDRDGIALGTAPRLRLPLPSGEGSVFTNFVERHTGARDTRYLYLASPEGQLAAHGETAPLEAVVMLDRREGAAVRIRPAASAQALQALISQNFSVAPPAGELLDRLHRLMQRLSCFVLTYDDLDEAVSVLAQAFETWPPRIEGMAQGGPSSQLVREHPEAGDVPADLAMRRSDDIELRQVDGELFLAGLDGGAIYHLNMLGAGVWNLLGEPMTLGEAAAVLQAAFPDADPAQVAGDVTALFAALAEAQLIAPASVNPDPRSSHGGRSLPR